MDRTGLYFCFHLRNSPKRRLDILIQFGAISTNGNEFCAFAIAIQSVLFRVSGNPTRDFKDTPFTFVLSKLRRTVNRKKLKELSVFHFRKILKKIALESNIKQCKFTYPILTCLSMIHPLLVESDVAV